MAVHTHRKDIYCIVSPLSQQAIDNGGDGAVERSILQWSNDLNNSNQRWKVNRQSNGNYILPVWQVDIIWAFQMQA